MHNIWRLLNILGNLIHIYFQTLTSQIGTALDLEHVEYGLEDYRSTNNLSFDQYRYYLFKEVFSALPDEMSIEDQHKYEAKIDEVSWSFCSTYYLERDHPIFPNDCVYQLFRIFAMLGDMVENDQGQIEVIFLIYWKSCFIPISH